MSYVDKKNDMTRVYKDIRSRLILKVGFIKMS